jgi:phosphate transport system substrate-binding protein
MMIKIKFIFIAIIFVVLSFFSCSREKKDKYTDTLTEGVISVAVDETFAPILQDEIAVFESVFPKAGIVPIFTTEGNAIELLLKDSVRMAITTRPLSDKELKSLQARKFQPRLYRSASDAIALVVNKSNTDTLITVDQFRQILLGKVTNWNQIYPNSTLGKIVTVFDNANSSTVRYAIDSVCGGQPLATNLNAQSTNREVLEYVAKTPQAIGIVGVNWLANKVDTTNLSFNDIVKIMSVSNETVATIEGSYKPFQAYMFYDSYPLTRNIFIILNDPRSSLPTGFTSFLTSQRGQRIILKSGLLPATQPLRVVHVKEE